ncbi:MAG: class I tRNA ligase family protein, partial [Candidatus Korarchaeum sp.]|nr:class I tRNA ligase family protein [Candidatus Korarchaeum sp.]
GALLAKSTIIHKYPVCWRCDSPLVIRTTKQWFIRLSDIREKLLSESDSVKWVPKWGGERRFRDWLLGIEDWIISRQRYWGIPIPIWICDRCGNLELIGSSKELEERSGVKLEDLHRPWVDSVPFGCKSCGGIMRRVPDIMDVWYDSGISFFASFGYPYKNRESFYEVFPVDFITEGHDQVRGWFFSLLRIGVLLFSRAPYKSVLMHGFMLDERGREMHKRLGNYVPPQEIIKKYGRDCFRAFVLTKVPWQDLRFSWKSIEDVERKLNIIWNVYVFASTYIGDREVRPLDMIEMRDPINKWLISRLNTMMKNFREAMEEYNLHVATNEVINFLIEDVSHLYLRVSRRKIRSRDELVSSEWSSVLYHVLKETLPYLSIVTPFLAEKIYLDSFKMEGDPESINMILLPQPDNSIIDKELESLMEVAKMIISSAGQARANVGLKKRQPLRKMIVSSENPYVRKAVEVFAEVIAIESNVKNLELGSRPEGGRWAEGSFNGGKVYISLDVGEEEILEGLSREIIRRIQLMRKELGLTLGVERIEVYIQGDDVIRKSIEDFYDEITWNSDADTIHVVESSERISGISFGREWEIDGRKVFIWVRKL